MLISARYSCSGPEQGSTSLLSHDTTIDDIDMKHCNLYFRFLSSGSGILQAPIVF